MKFFLAELLRLLKEQKDAGTFLSLEFGIDGRSKADYTAAMIVFDSIEDLSKWYYDERGKRETPSPSDEHQAAD